MQLSSSNSEMFRAYESEFQSNINSAKKCIEGQNVSDSQSLSKSSEFMQEADQCLIQMQLSATSSNMPKEFQDIIRNCVKAKNQLREEIEKYKYQNAEKLLFSNQLSKNQMSQNLLNPEDRLSEQNLKLVKAKQIAYEAEQSALSTQQSLYQQSETMKKSITQTILMRDDLGESNSIVNKMKDRIKKRRVLVYSLISLFLLCSIFILYSWLK